MNKTLDRFDVYTTGKPPQVIKYVYPYYACVSSKPGFKYMSIVSPI